MKKINVHGHILNYGCCPNQWLLAQAHIPEWLLKLYSPRAIVWLLTKLVPGSKFDRTAQMMGMFKKTLYENADDYYYLEMVPNDIELFTPLVMDMDYATDKHDKAELGYSYIVTIMSEIARSYYGVIMPFYGFDPRRDEAATLAKNAINNMGYIGIKMYTRLGFSPWDESPINTPQTNTELSIIYKFCHEFHVPITVHCSPGGAYSQSLVGYKEKADVLAHPRAWEPVLKAYPNLKLNFAHFGQSLHELNTWTRTIMRYMNEYEFVFADLAYHDDAIKKKKKENYFKALTTIIPQIPRHRVMLGTDYPMTAHTYREHEYYEPFETALPEELLESFNVTAPMRFLFDGRFPLRIQKAFGKRKDDIPVWLAEQIKKIKI